MHVKHSQQEDIEEPIIIIYSYLDNPPNKKDTNLKKSYTNTYYLPSPSHIYMVNPKYYKYLGRRGINTAKRH